MVLLLASGWLVVVGSSGAATAHLTGSSWLLSLFWLLNAERVADGCERGSFWTTLRQHLWHFFLLLCSLLVHGLAWLLILLGAIGGFLILIVD